MKVPDRYRPQALAALADRPSVAFVAEWQVRAERDGNGAVRLVNARAFNLPSLGRFEVCEPITIVPHHIVFRVVAGELRYSLNGLRERRLQRLTIGSGAGMVTALTDGHEFAARVSTLPPDRVVSLPRLIEATHIRAACCDLPSPDVVLTDLDQEVIGPDRADLLAAIRQWESQGQRAFFIGRRTRGSRYDHPWRAPSHRTASDRKNRGAVPDRRSVIINAVEYPSVSAASRALGMDKSVMSRRLRAGASGYAFAA